MQLMVLDYDEMQSPFRRCVPIDVFRLISSISANPQRA